VNRKSAHCDELRDRVSHILADIEAELRHVDGAEQQIADHAEDAERKLRAELKRRAGTRPTGDQSADGEYLYLLQQRRAAALVGAMAQKNTVRDSGKRK